MHDDTTPIAETLERLERAEHLKLKGKYSEALEILEQLLIEDPENISALEEVADNELNLEQYDRAEVAAKQTVMLDNESYTGHYILGFLRSVSSDWEKAADHLRKANASRPNNAEILRCLGWALFNMGQKAQGIVTLERALNLDSENAFTLCDLGITYLQTRNFPKAKALFERALNLDPTNPKAIECIHAMGKLEEAMKKGKQTA